MSLSPPHSPINLYCSEVADDEVELSYNIPFPYLDPSHDDDDDDDESFIVGLFDSELDGVMHRSERLPVLPDGVGARRDIVNWMLKVHSYYNFRPETAYLSVSYLDRFLCNYDLTQGKEWSLQLLAVGCISLGAKMEETTIPLLLDLQVMEPRFHFTAVTIQKMELLVMAALKWRLKMVTPFSFLDYFISKFPCFSSQFHNFSNVSDLILSSRRVVDHLEFLPSSIAAAALLWVSGKDVEDETLEHFHKRVNKEMVKRCHYLIKQSRHCSMPHVKRQRLMEPFPPSPEAVLDADISDSSCGSLECSSEDSKSSLD